MTCRSPSDLTAFPVNFWRYPVPTCILSRSLIQGASAPARCSLSAHLPLSTDSTSELHTLTRKERGTLTVAH